MSASPDEQLDTVRRLLAHATGALLHHTIDVDEDDWRGPSRLPGWSRGHVATHLARQADGLGRVVGGLLAGERAAMYPGPTQREDEIDAGADRSGRDLQVDLDASASRLDAAFDAVGAADRWSETVELRGGFRTGARLLPLARLTEVVLHHVDLDIGVAMADVEEDTAGWLLEWSALRLRERDEFPRLTLVWPTGSVTVGSVGPGRRIQGDAATLLGWLSGRLPPDAVAGADGLRPPAL